MTYLWQVLIPTIPHRHTSLLRLLAQLGERPQPGFSVLLYRDNLEASIAAKRETLLAASAAEYVSFADDDDEVLPGFVPLIMDALCERPDYIGFPVRCEINGEEYPPAQHSLRYDGWHFWPELNVRDISHLNPLRRDIALRGTFSDLPGDPGGEDVRWADGVRATGLARSETWITQPMYLYHYREADSHLTRRRPWKGPLPALPSYPWLEVLP